ncbi:hypothetical protein E2562_037257 [Oryza meyeriana var. granulata]|uniref:Uncharacterized protein n=1 Tax=Oryza meyeriana var. granulata TaxID=110450 RepID=A0A6G1EDJ0_9ORYZ|nr:hypothetical protein E2562_037257 [Oryza meyeriana var. granulata]
MASIGNSRSTPLSHLGACATASHTTRAACFTGLTRRQFRLPSRRRVARRGRGTGLHGRRRAKQTASAVAALARHARILPLGGGHP